MPFWQALLLAYGGYLNIVANAAALLARYAVPLADAPLVTTGIGFVLQAVPAVLVLTSRASWLRSGWAMGAVILSLCAAPAVEEVWLQTLHSQNHLALASALIIAFDDEPRRWIRWLRRGVLLLAPLAGVIAVTFLPLMLARAALQRSRERIVQCILLGAGSLVQIGWFYSASGGSALGRPEHVRPELLLDTVFLRHLMLPFTGVSLTQRLGARLYEALEGGQAPVWEPACLTIAGAALGLAILRQRPPGAPWLFAAFVTAAGSYAAGLHPELFLDPILGERYSFVPQVLMACTLVAVAGTARHDWTGRIAAVLLGWISVVGLLDYPRSRQTCMAAGPSWRGEVARWESDPGYALHLWPASWRMELTRDHGPVVLRVQPPDGDALVPCGGGP